METDCIWYFYELVFIIKYKIHLYSENIQQNVMEIGQLLCTIQWTNPIALNGYFKWDKCDSVKLNACIYNANIIWSIFLSLNAFLVQKWLNYVRISREALLNSWLKKKSKEKKNSNVQWTTWGGLWTTKRCENHFQDQSESDLES